MKRPAPHCSRCDRDHYNFISCEQAVEKQKKLAAEHWMQPGSVPWGAGFSYHSRPAAVRQKAHPLNTITPPRKETDGTNNV